MKLIVKAIELSKNFKFVILYSSKLNFTRSPFIMSFSGQTISGAKNVFTLTFCADNP